MTKSMLSLKSETRHSIMILIRTMILGIITMVVDTWERLI